MNLSLFEDTWFCSQISVYNFKHRLFDEMFAAVRMTPSEKVPPSLSLSLSLSLSTACINVFKVFSIPWRSFDYLAARCWISKEPFVRPASSHWLPTAELFQANRRSYIIVSLQPKI